MKLDLGENLASNAAIERLYLPDLDEVVLLNHIRAQFTALRYFSLDETYGVGHKKQASMIGRKSSGRSTAPIRLADTGEAA